MFTEIFFKIICMLPPKNIVWKCWRISLNSGQKSCQTKFGGKYLHLATISAKKLGIFLIFKYLKHIWSQNHWKKLLFCLMIQWMSVFFFAWLRYWPTRQATQHIYFPYNWLVSERDSWKNLDQQQLISKGKNLLIQRLCRRYLQKFSLDFWCKMRELIQLLIETQVFRLMSFSLVRTMHPSFSKYVWGRSFFLGLIVLCFVKEIVSSS